MKHVVCSSSDDNPGSSRKADDRSQEEHKEVKRFTVKIEQKRSRHRIGQPSGCYLWNVMACWVLRDPDKGGGT